MFFLLIEPSSCSQISLQEHPKPQSTVVSPSHNIGKRMFTMRQQCGSLSVSSRKAGFNHGRQTDPGPEGTPSSRKQTPRTPRHQALFHGHPGFRHLCPSRKGRPARCRRHIAADRRRVRLSQGVRLGRHPASPLPCREKQGRHPRACDLDHPKALNGEKGDGSKGRSRMGSLFNFSRLWLLKTKSLKN